jgi:hypothetical protein
VSKSAPQVVLLGKGKSDHTDEMSKLIDDIKPENIPAQFLEGVYVTTPSGKKYQIDPRLYADRGLNYKNVGDYIDTLKLNINESPETIEVVIDLDATKKILSKSVKSLTDILEGD